MIKSLIAKEINITSLALKFKKENILNTLLEIIIYVGFIVIEVYLFHMLSKKFEAYNGVEEAFLVIYLTIISLFLILLLTLQSRKSIFSVTDAEIMLTRPIRPIDNMISKVLFIYIKNVLLNFCVAFPILVSYSINLHLEGYVIVFCILYPFLMSLLETGFACFLALPAEKISKLLSRSVIFQLIFSIIIIFAVCFIYSYILNVFMVLVKDGNIQTIFTNETLEVLKSIGSYCIPVRFFIPIFNLNFIPLIYMLLIVFAVMVLGVFLGSKFYLDFIKAGRETKTKVNKKFKKQTSPIKALLIKEAKLIFSSNSIFSFAGLLFMEPILTFAIVRALNVIFKSGVFSFLTSIYDFILPVVGMIFVTLFSVIINTSSSFILQREGSNGIKICKLIPVSYKKQVLIKTLVPFAFSVFALLVSVIVLVSFGEIGIINGLLSFIIAVVLQIFMEMVCITSEFRSGAKEGSSLAALLEGLSVLLPIIIVGLIALLSYFGMNFYIAFLIPFGIVVIGTILYFILFSKRINRKFILLETRN